MKLITARVPAHAVADLTAQERDVMQDILRKRAARDLPVTFDGGALEVSVLPCTPAQHQVLAAHLAHLRALKTRTPADTALLAAFGG